LKFLALVKEYAMKHKLLLVDDEETMLKYLSRFLIKMGFDISTAMNGSEALEKIKQQDFITVLLDVLMPGMDGIETLREIKKIKPMTEVIMLTGHASVQVAIEGMRLGAFDYLMKPFDRDELIKKLRLACEKRLFNEKGIDAVNIPEMTSKDPA
jgi:DNA-binding NtrC family response regulator